MPYTTRFYTINFIEATFSGMPCSCQVPAPNYPENQEWGPFLWSILHVLAERVTRVMSPLYENDERRAWVFFLHGTGNMLPCSDCRTHYASYLSAHPVKEIMTLPKSELALWIRRWLYDLHQEVNTRLGKEGIPFEELSSHYKNINIASLFQLFEMIEKRAIASQGVNLISWLEWVKQYRTLCSIYGI